MKRFTRAVLPAFMLAVSVGQIYAFTNFSTEIATSGAGLALYWKAAEPQVLALSHPPITFFT